MVQIRATDDDERQILEDIAKRGWHLIAINDDPRGSALAYSIGLYHTLGHPEVILFGLNSVQTMGQIVNDIGYLIRQGHRFEDGAETDELLEGYSCRFRQVPVDVYPEYFGYAMWFYRPDPFPAVQCFWPDRAGHFPWEAGCAASTRERQPILAHRRGWRFFEPQNQAVFTTRPVLDDGLPILRVVHDADGDWQFLCGDDDRPQGRAARIAAVDRRHEPWDR